MVKKTIVKMRKMLLIGTLKDIKETQQINSNFIVRTFVLIEDSGDTPEYLTFQLHQELCNALDDVEVGSTIEVDFVITGRPWKDKYINTLLVKSINIINTK